MKLASLTLAATFLFSLLALGTSNFAQATSHGNNFIFDKTYGKIGKWKILHGRDMGDTCVAEQDNTNFTLRILHTDYTGDWYIGVPNYQDQNFTGGMSVNIGGSASVESWSDAVEFNTGHVNGWAMVFFQQRIRNDLKRGASVELDAGQGRQRWSLSGSSKAIAMLQECAQNQGKRPARKVIAQPAQPVPQIQVSAGSCPSLGQYRAQNSNQTAAVQFFNQTGNPNGALQIYWIDYNGSLMDIAIFDNNRAVVNSYIGHSFVVRDRDGRCYGGVYTISAPNNQFTIR